MQRAGDPFALEDRKLLGECEVDTYRASGPGGQHRNRTESAVRLRHGPSGIAVHAHESRSQHENRARALRRLREALVLQLRAPVGDLERYSAPDELRRLFEPARRPSTGNPDYWRGVAGLLDLFVACGCSVADTARLLESSTGAVSRRLTAQAALHARVNALREARGLRRLR
jgi:hypothetical protein